MGKAFESWPFGFSRFVVRKRSRKAAVRTRNLHVVRASTSTPSIYEALWLKFTKFLHGALTIRASFVVPGEHSSAAQQLSSSAAQVAMGYTSLTVLDVLSLFLIVEIAADDMLLGKGKH